MNYCPLMSYAKQCAQEIPCLGEECALAADGAGECLIKQALSLYVSGERTKRAEEERLQADQLRAYFENIAPSGYRWPSDVRIDTSPSFDNISSYESLPF